MIIKVKDLLIIVIPLLFGADTVLALFKRKLNKNYRKNATL